MNEGATLIDGHEMHRLHPDTFEIPTEGEIANLRKGSFVKIGVTIPPNHFGVTAERFWALVERTTPDFLVRVYQGDMIYDDEHGIKHNDLMVIEPRHILATQTQG